MVVYGQRSFHNRRVDFVKLTAAFNTSGHFESNHYLCAFWHKTRFVCKITSTYNEYMNCYFLIYFVNYVWIKRDYLVGSFSKQPQSKTSSFIYLILYSLPDLTKSESENKNGCILVNTFLEILNMVEISFTEIEPELLKNIKYF